jgi:hypothetical protein
MGRMDEIFMNIFVTADAGFGTGKLAEAGPFGFRIILVHTAR